MDFAVLCDYISCRASVNPKMQIGKKPLFEAHVL